ncbi:MAG: hypothetical protein K1X78_10410 [Verrucomicrobiaceae bacterium]|nr:hypothetical protein [Verrucomicrobiaceae bacterium]
MANEILIAHFDDEPSTVEWLPMALYDYFIDFLHPNVIPEDEVLEQRNDYRKGGRANGGGYRLEFPVILNYRKVKLIYVVVPDQEGFLEFARREQPTIVLLDLGQGQQDGTIKMAGTAILEMIVQEEIITSDRVIIHTAYPETWRRIGPAAQHCLLFPKPADGAHMVEHLAKMIDQVLANESHVH